MGYCLSVKVDTEERAERLFERLEKVLGRPEFKEFTPHISKDSLDHPYSPNIEPAIFISYNSGIGRVNHKFIWNICHEIAKELDTEFYIDDELIDKNEPINWRFIKTSNGILGLIEKFFNRKYNEVIDRYYILYKTYIEPIVESKDYS